MGRKKTRRLTAAQFAAAMQLVGRMSDERREAARLALVEGRTAQSIANVYGWQRTSVNNAETAVWRAHESYLAAKRAESLAEPLPRGWGHMELIAPRAVLRKLARLLAETNKDSDC